MGQDVSGTMVEELNLNVISPWLSHKIRIVI